MLYEPPRRLNAKRRLGSLAVAAGQRSQRRERLELAAAAPVKSDQEPPRTQFGLKSLFGLITAVGLYCLTIGRMPIEWHAMFITSVIGLLHAIPCVEYGYLRGLVLYRVWGWLLFCGSFVLFAFAIGGLLWAVALWCYARLWFGSGPLLGP